MSKENPQILQFETILLHRIAYWIGEENTIMDPCDIEHVTHQITNGCWRGELNHGEQEIRGWWKID